MHVVLRGYRQGTLSRRRRREKARRHCEDTPLHPRLLNPSLSESFVEVLAAMMEKDPAKRIPTAADVVERLKPWAGESVSSPRDPDEARRRREGDFELDSGGGELVDTSVSFEFDLAVPSRRDGLPPEPSAPISARRLIQAAPIPAKPISGLAAAELAQIRTDRVSPLNATRKRQSWSITWTLALAAATVLGGIIALLVRLLRD